MSLEALVDSCKRRPCDLPTPISTDSFWLSDLSPLLKGHRSTRELPRTADIVIIGSGITGTSIAYHLREKNVGDGLHIVMLEAREACSGATGRNGGHCVPQFDHLDDPSIGHFELANFRAIQSLISEKQIDEAEFVQQRGLRALYDDRQVAGVQRLISVMRKTAPDLAQLVRLTTDRTELEDLRIAGAVGAVVTSVAARLWPYKFVSRLLEDLVMSNGFDIGTFNLQTLTPVDRISPSASGTWKVETARGSIRTSKVVLATNGYTSHLLPALTDLIVPCRGQMSALVPLPSLSGDNRLKTSFSFAKNGSDDYLCQRSNKGGGELMFGGGGSSGRLLGTADDSAIDESTARYLRTFLVDALGLPENVDRNKTIEFEATYEWTGIMGYSKDGLPWIGQMPETPNLYLAAGFTGHGMPFAWLSGKAVALMIHEHQQETVGKETGLPKAFLISEERLRRAKDLKDVEEWNECMSLNLQKSLSLSQRNGVDICYLIR